MSALPANLPDISGARLPATYEAAKAALAECSRIDECQNWADKAAAMASYARQSNDDTLFKLATRIQARAVRRCGELLQQYDGRGDHRKSNGAGTSSQATVARDAGLSKRQQVTAVRLANIPADNFDDQVESDDPPTVTKLAEQGKKPRLNEERPENFQAATMVMGAIRRCVEVFSEYEPEFVIQGIGKYEVAEMREAVGVMDAWLDRFIVNLPR